MARQGVLWRSTWTIARRDAIEIWRSGRFRWASLLLLAILGAALSTGWWQTAEAARSREAAERAERGMQLAKGAMNPHAAAHYGAFVFKPVAPLSAVDPGLSPFVGSSVFLEAHVQDLTRYQPVDDASPFRGVGPVTAALALQVLVPLLIVLATAPAFAAEREDGTLAQLLSMGTSRASLALGKAVGAALPLAAVLLPAMAIGVTALVWTSPADPPGDIGLRAALLSATYLVSFAIWMALGLAVSARSRSATAALALSFGLWMLAAVVAPPVALLAAQSVAPSTRAGESVRTIESARAALPRWDRRVEDVEERFLTGALDLTPDVPSNPEVVALVEAEAAESALYDDHFARVFAAFERQAAGYTRVGMVVPTLAVQALSMALAGTDYGQHHRFVAATGDYRRAFLGTLNQELTSYGALDTFDYAGDRALWARVPAFRYEGPRVSAVFAAHRATCGALALWLVLAAGFLVQSVRTIRVTS